MAEEYVISVVLEGNASSMTQATKKGSKSQKDLENATKNANIAMLAQLARFQAMTAAMNQTVGGLNKLAGGLEALGFERSAEAMRKFTKIMELIIGPMEIYLAYKTLSIAMSYGDAKAKTTDAAATGVLAVAQGALNAVMAMNPFILIAMAIVIVVLALIHLEKKFGIITKAVDALNDGLQALEELLLKIVRAAKGLISTFVKFHPANIAGKGMKKLIGGAKG